MYRSPWLRLREDQVLRPNGQPGLYGVVEMVDAVGVVALTDDERVYLVGQHRYPTDHYGWEIVAGYGDPLEGPLESARRELREETGLSADEWTPLGICHLSNSVTDQVGHLFLARALSAGEAAPDETEALAVRTLPLAEALGLAQSGQIVQAFSLVGLYRAWHHLRGGV